MLSIWFRTFISKGYEHITGYKFEVGITDILVLMTPQTFIIQTVHLNIFKNFKLEDLRITLTIPPYQIVY